MEPDIFPRDARRRAHPLIHRLLIAATLILATAGPTAAADVITLDNGDRVSGDFQSWKGGKITIKTGYSKDLSLPVARIAGFATDGPVTLKLQGGGYISGVLRSPYRGAVTVSGPRGAQTGAITLADVVEAYPGTEVPRGFKWRGNVNLGASLRTGNANTKSLHIDGEVVGRATDDRISIRGNFNREIDDGSRTEDDFRLIGQHDHFVEKKTYFYSNAKLERDTLADLQLRTTIGTGIGWQIYESDRMNLSVEGGPAYVDENLVMAEDEHFIAGRWAVNFDHKIWNDTWVFFHRHEGTIAFQSPTSVFINSSTGVRVPLSQHLTLTAQADVDWDSDPPGDAGRSDTTWLLTVGYRW